MFFTGFSRSCGVRRPDRPWWRRRGPGNLRLTVGVIASVLLQLSIHHVPALQRLFGFQPISLGACAGLLVLGTVPLSILELRKVLTAGSTSDA